VAAGPAAANNNNNNAAGGICTRIRMDVEYVLGGSGNSSSGHEAATLCRQQLLPTAGSRGNERKWVG
jgi:hypothetical protein